MEKLVSVRELFKQKEKYLNTQISVGGWVRSIRDSKTFGFIVLNDGTFFEPLQIVYSDKLENFEKISKLNVGAALIVKGQLVPTPEAKQPFEIQADEIVVEGESTPDYPLQKKRHSMEYLRTITHLRPRTNTFQATFRVRSLIAMAIHEFFQQRDFVYVHTPIITGSDCEGAGEMFRVTTLNKIDDKTDFKDDFFGKSTNLTVSGQLQAETFALAFKKTYTFGPTFRAENSNTKTHASEFWMIEPEVAFCDLDGIMDIEEDMLKYIIKYVLEHAYEEIAFCDKFVENGLIDKLKHVVNTKAVRITHKEAVDILLKAKDKFENVPSYAEDLATEHEKYLTKDVYNAPVFVKDWPKDIKAFYMRMNDDNKTVAAVDLLVPGAGELMGGSQREERYDYLVKRMDDMGVPKEDLYWYINLRKFGGCKHSGFGMGFERLLIYLTGVENIRDVIPYPRTPKNCEF